MKVRVTRGFGFFERYLSRKRRIIACAHLFAAPRQGSILDIGCGMDCSLLRAVAFNERHGIDQVEPHVIPPGVVFHRMDIEHIFSLPFPRGYFDAVTMLAVVEHMTPEAVQTLLCEIWRVLGPGGLLILTTPRPGTDFLLRGMARMHLVSKEEIEEHTHEYGRHELNACLAHAGFALQHVRHGTFECGLNTWVEARK